MYVCAYCMYECIADMYIHAYVHTVGTSAMYTCTYVHAYVCAYGTYVRISALYMLCVPSEVNSCSCHILFLKHLED